MTAVNGRELRARRLDSGLSIKDLAGRIGRDETTLTKVELGQRGASVNLLADLVGDHE